MEDRFITKLKGVEVGMQQRMESQLGKMNQDMRDLQMKSAAHDGASVADREKMKIQFDTDVRKIA